MNESVINYFTLRPKNYILCCRNKKSHWFESKYIFFSLYHLASKINRGVSGTRIIVSGIACGGGVRTRVTEIRDSMLDHVSSGGSSGGSALDYERFQVSHFLFSFHVSKQLWCVLKQVPREGATRVTLLTKKCMLCCSAWHETSLMCTELAK